MSYTWREYALNRGGLADDSGDVLPRQLFEVAIQAAIGTRVVARETLSAVRKDVTAGLYGGMSTFPETQ